MRTEGSSKFFTLPVLDKCHGVRYVKITYIWYTSVWLLLWWTFYNLSCSPICVWKDSEAASASEPKRVKGQWFSMPVTFDSNQLEDNRVMHQGQSAGNLLWKLVRWSESDYWWEKHWKECSIFLWGFLDVTVTSETKEYGNWISRSANSDDTKHTKKKLMYAALGVRDVPNRPQQALGFRLQATAKIFHNPMMMSMMTTKPPGRNNRSNKMYQTMGKLLTLYVDERKNTWAGSSTKATTRGDTDNQIKVNQWQKFARSFFLFYIYSTHYLCSVKP